MRKLNARRYMRIIINDNVRKLFNTNIYRMKYFRHKIFTIYGSYLHCTVRVICFMCGCVQLPSCGVLLRSSVSCLKSLACALVPDCGIPNEAHLSTMYSTSITSYEPRPVDTSRYVYILYYYVALILCQ